MEINVCQSIVQITSEKLPIFILDGGRVFERVVGLPGKKDGKWNGGKEKSQQKTGKDKEEEGKEGKGKKNPSVA